MHDLEGIYGAACFGDKRLTDFLNAVQIVWDAVTKAGVPMREVVEDRTGFDFGQVAKLK